MKKTLLILIASVVMIHLWATSLTYTKVSTGEIKINFQVPDYSIQKESLDGKEQHKLKVTNPDEENWQENFSGLPQLEKWVYIPEGYEAQVTVEQPETQVKSNYLCDVEQTDKDIAEWLDVSQTVNFRGNRLLSLCIKPFQYNNVTKQLTTLNRADIRIRFTPTQSQRCNPRLYTPATVEMLKAICINRDDIRESNQKPGSMLIFYNGATLTNLIQPLADWKHQKGYDVRMINTSTIGNNYGSIKDYIQNAYDTWDNPPEYILILGKGTPGIYQVPPYADLLSYNYPTHGDYPYTLLDGSGGDIVPDAYVGRLTFSSTDELQMIVNKIINYETMQGLSTTTWLNKSLLLGDTEESGVSTQTTMLYIKSLMQTYNSDAQLTEVYSGNFPSLMNSNINSGIGTFWYRGHGEFSGWTINDISNLNNAGKPPFISFVTCFSGNFGTSNQVCPAEKLMRIGTPSIPKGAIGVIGASCETHTCLNNIMTGGFAYAAYREDISQCGPILVRGKLALQANYPQNPSDYLDQNFLSINLFGDPSLDIFLKPASDIVVSAPTQLYPAGGNAAIRVTYTDETPVENAWVCLTKGTDEVFVSGYTNANGIIVLPYGALTEGTARLTITKPQHKTFLSNINVSTTAANITMQNITALNQCYAGSNLSFPITITNNGATTLTNVSGTLQSLCNDITFQHSTSGFGNLNASSNATSMQNFQLSINTDISKGESIYLNLHLTYTGGSFDIPFSCTENGANFAIQTVAFNGGILNHGTNQLTISIHNASQTAVSGLQSVLESSNPYVTISNSEQSLGNVAASATISMPSIYTVQVADSLLEGMNLRLYLRLFNATGFSQTLYIDKIVGSPSTNDITGPDAYGYICYGTGDDGYKPYNWIELDPSLGGTGTALSLTDSNSEGSGDYATIALPFQFRFYSKAYSSITICSNGFIMPGNQGSIEWMNWQIPGPLVPAPIIAPFWDDLLLDNNSRILYKYDSNLHAEIVQWQNLKNKYSPSMRETFQAILYDPSVELTQTGDSPILFQYKTFNNVDGGNYGLDYVDHGQYATIGIANHTGLVGLQYSFNNQYPSTATVLSNLSTLYFCTIPNYQAEPNPILLNCQMTEVSGNGNGQVDFGEHYNLSMTIKNMGQGVVNSSQMILSSTDPYVTITQNTAMLQALYYNQVATTSPAFSVQIAQNCPNNHIIHFNILIQSLSEQFNLPYEIMVHAYQFGYSDMEVTDNNNNMPEQGETVQVIFNLSNVSTLSAQNVIVTLNQPTGVTVNPPSQTINLASMATQSLSFQVALSNSILQGSMIDLGPHVVVTGCYDSLMTMTMVVGVPELNLNTGFEEADISTVVLDMINASILPAQYIHTTGMEANLSFPGSYVYSYMFFYPISTADILNSRIKFTWFNGNDNANLSLQVFYSNSQNMTSIWNTSIQTSTPQTTIVDLSEFPPQCEYVIFMFFAQRFGEDVAPICLDDISIYSIHHAPALITGHVELDLHQELVSQVRLTKRYSTAVYYPDAQGDFSIPAYQGEVVIYANMDGYYYPADSLTVNVISGQTCADNVIALQRLRNPVDLAYTLEGNVLHLNWGLEGDQATKTNKLSPAKQDRYLEPDHYRIYFKCNTLNFQANSETQSYDRNLVLSGNYQIFVCSVFLFNGEEVYSDSSNVISFQYTPDEDEHNLPLVFALQQNMPNPFNPTTLIKFSLPEKSMTSLQIYNLKGQLVKTLIDCDYPKGNHSVVWNGKDNNDLAVSSGIYYYKLKWNNKEQTRKMVMLK